MRKKSFKTKKLNPQHTLISLFFLVSGFNPFEKYYSSQIGSLPQGCGVKIKHLQNHHLVLFLPHSSTFLLQKLDGSHHSILPPPFRGRLRHCPRHWSLANVRSLTNPRGWNNENPRGKVHFWGYLYWDVLLVTSDQWIISPISRFDTSHK